MADMPSHYTMGDEEFERVARLGPEDYAKLPQETRGRYERQRQINFAERCTMDSDEGVRTADGRGMDEFLADVDPASVPERPWHPGRKKS